MNKGIKILALDPSSTNVGWCMAEGAGYVSSGVFSPRGDADARIRQIATWAAEMLAEHLPDLVVLEEPAGDHGNRKTDRLLARVGGVIEGLAVTLVTADILRVWPSQVKASGCHKHALRVAAHVAGKLVVGPDEADAIGVWGAALARGVTQ